MNYDIQAVKVIVKKHPSLLPHLKGRARWIACLPEVYTEPADKTEGAFYRQIYNRIQDLYNGNLDTSGFLDAVSELVQQQLTRAFRQALRDNEMDPDLVNQDGEGFKDELEAMILSEYDYVDRLAADVLQAAKDGADVSTFQARAELWSKRYADAYNQAQVIITRQMGGKLEWQEGDTEKKCPFCRALNGIVLYAKEWQSLGVRPQSPPNPMLTGERDGERGCSGWLCDCHMIPTDKRKTPNGFQMVMDIVNK